MRGLGISLREPDRDFETRAVGRRYEDPRQHRVPRAYETRTWAERSLEGELLDLNLEVDHFPDDPFGRHHLEGNGADQFAFVQAFGPVPLRP